MEIVSRMLEFGSHTLSARDSAALSAPYMLAGKHMYALGNGSTLLSPIGREHLIGQMGGIWAHPARIADGLTVLISDGAGQIGQPQGVTLTERLSEVAWSWRCDALAIERRDWVVPDLAVYVTQVALHNTGSVTAQATLEISAQLSFLGCWFGAIAVGESRYWQAGQLVLGQDGLQSGWGVALGGDTTPNGCAIAARSTGVEATLSYRVGLAPGATQRWNVLLAASLQGGAAASEQLLQSQIRALSRQPGVAYTGWSLPAGLVKLASEDAELDRDFALAQANLQLLDADYPNTGRYFLAGLPEYPQLFGCDTTYSIAGTLAAGFVATSRSALARLADYAKVACGRVPHEITTNGRVFHSGNVQETPQFTIALWDYLRWTGDLELTQQLFPICCEGMEQLLPALCGPNGIYPLGDGMVERLGMGERKLDSACYYAAGAAALAKLALALGEPDYARYKVWSEELQANIERDWWIEEEGLYADSMHLDGRLQLDGHWVAVLPVQLGLAAPARAKRVLERITGEFVNEWGLVHTRRHEESVWTLPTGLLALTCFSHGHAEQGLLLTRNIARTAQHGTLGTFKELIPIGLCFVQLWSAALYIQAIIEGLLGINPDAARHSLTIAPCMPPQHPPVHIYGLQVGAHTLDLKVAPNAVQVEHRAGPQPLSLCYGTLITNLDPGASFAQEGGGARA